MVGVDGGEPFEVEGFTMVWVPVDGAGPSIPAGTLSLDPVSFTVSGEMHDWFERLLRDSPEARERRAQETRLYWSGRPDEVTRHILRAFGVTARQIGLVQRSAFSPEYRRRQRARVKRRRR